MNRFDLHTTLTQYSTFCMSSGLHFGIAFSRCENKNKYIFNFDTNLFQLSYILINTLFLDKANPILVSLVLFDNFEHIFVLFLKLRLRQDHSHFFYGFNKASSSVFVFLHETQSFLHAENFFKGAAGTENEIEEYLC